MPQMTLEALCEIQLAVKAPDDGDVGNEKIWSRGPAIARVLLQLKPGADAPAVKMARR